MTSNASNRSERNTTVPGRLLSAICLAVTENPTPNAVVQTVQTLAPRHSATWFPSSSWLLIIRFAKPGATSGCMLLISMLVSQDWFAQKPLLLLHNNAQRPVAGSWEGLSLVCPGGPDLCAFEQKRIRRKVRTEHTTIACGSSMWSHDGSENEKASPSANLITTLPMALPLLEAGLGFVSHYFTTMPRCQICWRLGFVMFITKVPPDLMEGLADVLMYLKRPDLLETGACDVAYQYLTIGRCQICWRLGLVLYIITKVFEPDLLEAGAC